MLFPTKSLAFMFIKHIVEFHFNNDIFHSQCVHTCNNGFYWNSIVYFYDFSFTIHLLLLLLLHLLCCSYM